MGLLERMRQRFHSPGFRSKQEKKETMITLASTCDTFIDITAFDVTSSNLDDMDEEVTFVHKNDTSLPFKYQQLDEDLSPRQKRTNLHFSFLEYHYNNGSPKKRQCNKATKSSETPKTTSTVDDREQIRESGAEQPDKQHCEAQVERGHQNENLVIAQKTDSPAEDSELNHSSRRFDHPIASPEEESSKDAFEVQLDPSRFERLTIHTPQESEESTESSSSDDTRCLKQRTPPSRRHRRHNSKGQPILHIFHDGELPTLYEEESESPRTDSKTSETEESATEEKQRTFSDDFQIRARWEYALKQMKRMSSFEAWENMHGLLPQSRCSPEETAEI